MRYIPFALTRMITAFHIRFLYDFETSNFSAGCEALQSANELATLASRPSVMPVTVGYPRYVVNYPILSEQDEHEGPDDDERERISRSANCRMSDWI